MMDQEIPDRLIFAKVINFLSLNDLKANAFPGLAT
jgi:hypothetical protein